MNERSIDIADRFPFRGELRDRVIRLAEEMLKEFPSAPDNIIRLEIEERLYS